MSRTAADTTNVSALTAMQRATALLMAARGASGETPGSTSVGSVITRAASPGATMPELHQVVCIMPLARGRRRSETSITIRGVKRVVKCAGEALATTGADQHPHCSTP
jgi:hypothetical protein